MTETESSFCSLQSIFPVQKADLRMQYIYEHVSQENVCGISEPRNT